VTSERLQKVLAAAGLGSRRACEQMIADGRVDVNGAQAILGMSADPAADTIRVDGRPIPAVEPLHTYALYKPRGVVSSLDPQGNRSTVRDLLPLTGRYFPVGRLDMDSEGLILLTNDGDLAQRITHPRYEVEKEYRVLVARRPDTEQLQKWRRGIVLPDGVRTGPMQVIVESTEGKGAWLHVIMHEGRKHELREIGLCIGLPVVRIIRKRIGELQVGSMRPGQWRELTANELAAFGKLAGRRKGPRGGPKARRVGGRNAGTRTFVARKAAQPAEGGRDSAARPLNPRRPSQQRDEKRPTGNRPSAPREGARDSGPRPFNARRQSQQREEKRPTGNRPSAPREGGRDSGPRPFKSRRPSQQREDKRPAGNRPSTPREGGRDSGPRPFNPRRPTQQRDDKRSTGNRPSSRGRPANRRGGGRGSGKTSKRG
jgi:23S rRNA pseudouridine2605 synthase